MSDPEHRTYELPTLLQGARARNGTYRAPAADELTRVAEAGRLLLTAVTSGPDSGAAALFKSAHFDCFPTALDATAAIAVVEEPAYRRGGGIYVFRRGVVPRERIVQVPHSFFDQGTLPIGLTLASVAEARALFVNTVHRYQGHTQSAQSAVDGEEAEGPEAPPADLAHQEATFFQTLTRAAVTRLPQLQVLQLHGFADGADPLAPQAEVVVSAGPAGAGTAEAAAVASRLARLLGKNRVLLYPRDTRKLGAKTNVQGRCVAQQALATFLHLELSRSLRDRLVSSEPLRRAFAIAVIGAPGATAIPRSLP